MKNYFGNSFTEVEKSFCETFLFLVFQEGRRLNGTGGKLWRKYAASNEIVLKRERTRKGSIQAILFSSPNSEKM